VSPGPLFIYPFSQEVYQKPFFKRSPRPFSPFHGNFPKNWGNYSTVNLFPQAAAKLFFRGAPQRSPKGSQKGLFAQNWMPDSTPNSKVPQKRFPIWTVNPFPQFLLFFPGIHGDFWEIAVKPPLA